jgi:hypothetical protein
MAYNKRMHATCETHARDSRRWASHRIGQLQTLADIALDHFCLLMFEGPLDPDDANALSQAIPGYLESMTEEERAAFSAAAQRAIDLLLAEPDEHGYTPRKFVSDEQRAFLESAAAGDIFE